MQIPINDRKSSAKFFYELTNDLTGDFNALSVIVFKRQLEQPIDCIFS